MVTLNYNNSVYFRHLSGNSSRIASRCRPEKTFLLVAAFVVSLMVIGGAADVQHAGELEQVVASDHTPYHLIGGAWSILDLSAPQSGYAFAQTPDTPPAGAFVTTWKTTSANEIITFPANGTYTIDWGDGSSPSLNVENVQDHTYATAGNYTVKISGGLHAIDLSLNDRDNAAKLQSIEQWGNIEWSTMNSAFRDASNMVYNADDAPDLSGVTDMSSMFNGASSFNGDLSSWNVSSVTDMSDMFNDASSFNGDLSNWNVSSVENMYYMFNGASSFNGDLSSWDVSSVNYMTYMFNGASSFDQNLGNWYVVPADTAYVIAENTLKVTTISAQNAFLDEHLPSYGIGSGNNNSNLFNITDSNILMLKSVPPAGIYNVNVTASGVDFFEDGDNWRLLEIIVMTVDPENLVENRFVTTWKTTSANESITIPAIGSYTVRWSSSDIASEGASNSTSHVYPSPGTHTVSIHGGLEAIDLSGDSTNAAKLQSIEQWGNIEWNTMNSAFRGADNMVYNAGDAPDLSGVTDISGMFAGASSFNGNLSSWDVSSVTDMSGMFNDASSFNGDLSRWDVSSVTDMSGIFNGASSSFNGDLSRWDVSSVTDMSGMFNGTSSSSFNGDLSRWDVSSVENMSYMFYSSSSFNGDLSRWDVSSVENMSYMFYSSSSFNGDLSRWDVSSVENMSYMFYSSSSFNGDLSSWDVSSVTDMSSMFNGASSFNGDLSNWNVSSVTNMDHMFRVATSFDQNLGNWYIVPADTAYDNSEGTLNVTTISAQNTVLDNHPPSYSIGSGENSNLFNITDSNTLMLKSSPLTGTYIVKVTASGTVFENGNNWRLLEIEVTGQTTDTTPPVITVSGLNSTSVPVLGPYSDAGATCVDGVHRNLTVTPESNVDIGAPGTYTVTYSCTDFAGNEATATRTVTVTGDPVENHFVTTWRTTSANESIRIPASDGPYTVKWSNDTAFETLSGSQAHVYPSPGNYTVRIYGNLGSIDLSLDSTNAAKLQSIEQWGNIEWDTMNSAFRSADNMVYNAADAPDLSGVNNTSYMFYGASDFNGDLSNWDVSSVTDMSSMFELASAFNGDLSSWNVSSVTDMPFMFYAASSFNGDLSRWDVSSVTNMNRMFLQASSFNGDLSRWDVSSVDDMYSMFSGASDFNGDLSSWNVSSVTDMHGMFNDASSFNRPLSSWNVSSVTDMYSMFSGASSFDQNLGNWYVVPADTTHDNSEGTLRVTTISAQNAFLDDYHTPSYGIGSGSNNSNLFNITDSNTLMFKSAQSADTYIVNVTASVADVFANGNNWRLLEIEVTGQIIETPPLVIVPEDPVENHFVTTWRTTSANESITIPASDGPYTVKWSDDTAFETLSGSQAHVYPSPGNYTVRIYGNLGSIDLSLDSNNAAKLQSIEQWGNIEWDTMNFAFYGASNMVYNAADAPNLSGVNDLSNMFSDASTFNGDLSNWNVSSVTDTSFMFYNASSFNGDLASWDVSSVTDMSYMFYSSSSFNRPLASWDVSSVENMSFMFSGASSFDQNLGNWYVVPADTTYAISEGTLNVTTISTQNVFLDSNFPSYGIGSGSNNSTLFNITNSNTLMFKGAPSVDTYNVNVTASGTYVFADGNNWRVFAVSVSDDINALPVLTAIGPKSVNETVLLEFNAAATDADNDTLTFSLETGFPSGASITSAGAFSWTPTERQDGTSSITIKVSDNKNGTDSDTFMVTVNEVDTAPVLDAITTPKDVTRPNTLTFTATASDDDYRVNVADTVTFSLTGTPPLSGASITSAGDFSWTPAANQTGLHDVTVTVTDGTGLTDSKDVAITVTDTVNIPPTTNRPPTADAGPDRSVDEGGSIKLQGSGSDDDNDALTYSWSSQDSRLSFDNSSSATPTVTAFSVTANTTITLTLTVDDGTTSGEDTMVLTILDVTAATVNVGPDQTVKEGATVIMPWDARGPDGESLTYSWQQSPAQPHIILNNTDSSPTTFTAPVVDADTAFTFTLVVTAGQHTVEDSLTVTVKNNRPPTVDAGSDRIVNERTAVTLSGSASDPDGNDSDLTYLWSQSPATPVISFDNRTSATPEITAPSVTAETEITLTLRVDDGTDHTTDTMDLTILDVTAATVNVGPDQTVKEGATVIMPWDARGPDGESLTYSWSQDPLLPDISLNSENSSPTTFTAPVVDADTAFTFTLVVTAGQHTVEDSLTVTVKNNRPPTVDAGSDRIVNERTAVTLSGSASDPDGDTMTYAWTHDSGTSVDLTGSDTTRPQFTAPGVTSDEDIVFTFMVTDTASESADDTVTVTVRDVPISVLSATYNPGNGQLVITFNQDINSANYSAIHIRSTGSDSGGIALSDISGASHIGRIITATLDSEQQKEYGDLGSPQLDIEDGAVTDVDGVLITQVSDMPISDASRKKSSSSSKAPAVHIGALIQTRTVDIPPHIAEQIASHDASDPLEPLIPDGTFEFPLVINGYGYLLDDVTNTLVPQTVTAGDDDPTIITFTMYTQKDLAHFTLYLNLSDENTDYADSDTYITYKNDDGTTDVTDPHGYIGSATVTVTQEDDQIPEKKTVRITVEFAEPMGPTNMVAYMWNTDRKATFIKIIDAFEVAAALLEPVMQAADPEPVEPDSELPADPEPVAPDLAGDVVDPEPVSSDMLWPDDYDEAQVLHIIRMWSGFESEFITDTQLLELLGLEDYQGADLPDWMMTELGVLVARDAVTVDEFMLVLQYVLEHT